MHMISAPPQFTPVAGPSGTQRTLVFSQGDPGGVGPELLLRLASLGLILPGDRVFAGRDCLESTSDMLCASLAQRAGGVHDIEQAWPRRGLANLERALVGEASLGQVESLERAVDEVLASPGDRALVTPPIDKAAAMAEGLGYPGHTEYLAARAGVENFAMLMAGPTIRVALATIHIPLREVAERLRTVDVIRAASLLARALSHELRLECPRIGILALNPHAGEAGLIGEEEGRILVPAIEQLRSAGGQKADYRGPIPADTAFYKQAIGELDGLVAMYHDQGLAPFKLVHFHDGVNVTLGLPFVRTSPDHGTARDLVGQARANPASMIAATRLARGRFSDAWTNLER